MSDNTTTPRRLYSKSSAFYIDTKRDFFDANDSLLTKASRQNELYNHQPPRTLCKICGQQLPIDSDFVSHQVRYIFCTNCGHLNGANIDTESFVKDVYIEADGEDYAKHYLDNNFATRANQIYVPKLDFLCSSLPANVHLRLLDIGCGCGYFVYSALLKGFEAKGVDINKTMIDFGNEQISCLLKRKPLIHFAESDFFDSIANSDASVISAIGVVEHLRDPAAFFDAFHRSSTQYLFYSVPMFSLSVMLENVFPNIYPRQLSGDHTHLFTEQSLDWLHENRKLIAVAEWRFGTDVMDLYRAMRVEMTTNGASAKMLSFLNDGLGKNVDQLQAIFDVGHFCSEINCLVKKR